MILDQQQTCQKLVDSMKNLKIVSDNDLKDWAKEIFKKNSFKMIDVSQKKRHLEEHWLLEKFMLVMRFLSL